MSEPFIGEIRIFGCNFAPRGWAFCDGQLLPIAQYTALFSILGTTYGGDGRTTFALPDLRGRVPLGPRHGPGLTSYREGQRGGDGKPLRRRRGGAAEPSHSGDDLAHSRRATGRTLGRVRPLRGQPCGLFLPARRAG